VEAIMKTRFVAVAIVLLALARSASATTITPDGSWLEFQFDAGGTAEDCLVGCVTTTNPVASAALAPPWTFSGAATVTILDLFLSGDTFELFDNLVSVGVSSLPTVDGECGNNIGCALGDFSYSRLVVDLGPGTHSLTINNVASATAGGGAAVFRVAPSTTVPEPASMLLLSGALAVGLAARIRARRRDDAARTSDRRRA
jgi:hypothetical protein